MHPFHIQYPTMPLKFWNQCDDSPCLLYMPNMFPLHLWIGRTAARCIVFCLSSACSHITYIVRTIESRSSFSYHMWLIPDDCCDRSDLDDLSEGEHYQGDQFSVVMYIELLKPSEPCATPWLDHAAHNYRPDVLFSSTIEAEETRENFGEIYSCRQF